MFDEVPVSSRFVLFEVITLIYIFRNFLGFIKLTVHRLPANRPTTTYPPTHWLPTQRLTELIIIFERLGNRNIFRNISVILIDDENLQIPGYSIANVEHPSNKKPGGICLLQNFITSEAARYQIFTRITK